MSSPPDRYIFFSLLLLFFSACSTIRHEAYYSSSYGVASWYGADFHGRPTSSGEVFDMYKKTCAHKEYAFGTKLKVTNLANKKSVECVVNDRGPFVGGRDLDLSYAAAREIGVIGTGTARVLLEVSGRDNSYIRKVTVQSNILAGPFAIQIGSFTEKLNAIRLKAALNLRYGNVYVQETESKGAVYYRVRIGNFQKFETAVSVAEELGQEGYQPFVIKADTKI